MFNKVLKVIVVTIMCIIGAAEFSFATPYALGSENVEEKLIVDIPVLIKDEDVVWSVDSEKNRPKATYQNGEPLVGWFTLTYNDKKSRFCFDENGVVRIGWYQEGINIYFFDNEGRMITGVVEIDGEKYIFDDMGRYVWKYDYEREVIEFLEKNASYVITNDVEDGLFYMKSLSSNDMVLCKNRWFESQATGEKGWYAVDNEGRLLTGFVEYNGDIYYLSKRDKDKGMMVKNLTLEFNGANYIFDENGKFVGDKSSIKEEIYYIN